jgi:steroid delta-isomerase-like uncharacterized protein
MSNQSRESVMRRLVNEVWNQGRLEVIDELLTPDHVNADAVNPARGRDGFRDVVTKYRAAFPDCRIEVVDLFSSGDCVVIQARYRGTQKNALESIPATGRQVDVTGITIARFAGDRISETITNWDALGLMQQLGVVTLPGKAQQAGR